MNLVEMRERVRVALADTNGLVWKDEMLDESLHEALDMLSLALPCKRSVEIEAQAGVEVELNALPGLLDVLEVWRMGARSMIRLTLFSLFFVEFALPNTNVPAPSCW